MFSNVSCDYTILDDVETAPEIIDRLLLKCMQLRKPVYLGIPLGYYIIMYFIPIIIYKFSIFKRYGTIKM